MSTASQISQRAVRTEAFTNADEFTVVLGIDDHRELSELEAILCRLGTRYISATNVERMQAVLERVDHGLAIFSARLSGRRAMELIASHKRLNHRIPFALWFGQDVVDIDDVVTAMGIGALDVMHGAPCERRIESLVEKARRRSNPCASNSASGDGGLSPRSAQNDHEELAATTPTSCESNARATEKDFGTNGHSVETAVPVSVTDATCSVSPSNGAGQVISTGDAWLTQLLRGKSSVMEAIRNVIRHVAPTDATVMIHGESGTGKELVASAIHRLSRRAGQTFVPVNMAAIPHGLAESFLFGHEKGAFTSAIQKHKGWCRVAHSGTLFLDEIGEMESAIQPKLLRFLQERCIQTVGGQTVESVDVRLITATNQDPRDLVREGRLREDLFFRLNVIPIYIPPLRDRSDDIEELAILFLHRSAQRHGRPVRGYTDEAMKVLIRFDWPGNVRQLENLVERLVIFAKGELVEAMEIPSELHSPSRRRHPVGIGFSATSPVGNGHDARQATENGESVVDRLSPFQMNERTLIIDALQRSGGHVVEAAQSLGLGQATLYRKIKQYAIPHQRKRRKVSPR